MKRFFDARRLHRPLLAASMALLAACTTTGASFNTTGLDRIVVGRTTMDQASEYLGARPVDVWQQGGSTLARWAHKGTLATDAVYFRQEAWLRFGPDGTFQRMENGINLPLHRHPRTAEEADREAQQAERERAARQAAAQPAIQSVEGAAASSVDTAGAVPVAEPTEPAPLAVAPPAAVAAQPTQAGQAAAADQGAASAAANPLLPAGTQVVPGVTYPVSKH